MNLYLNKTGCCQFFKKIKAIFEAIFNFNFRVKKYLRKGSDLLDYFMP